MKVLINTKPTEGEYLTVPIAEGGERYEVEAEVIRRGATSITVRLKSNGDIISRKLKRDVREAV